MFGESALHVLDRTDYRKFIQYLTGFGAIGTQQTHHTARLQNFEVIGGQDRPFFAAEDQGSRLWSVGPESQVKETERGASLGGRI